MNCDRPRAATNDYSCFTIRRVHNAVCRGRLHRQMNGGETDYILRISNLCWGRAGRLSDTSLYWLLAITSPRKVDMESLARRAHFNHPRVQVMFIASPEMKLLTDESGVFLVSPARRKSITGSLAFRTIEHDFNRPATFSRPWLFAPKSSGWKTSGKL
jgi:hypothetical protein